MKYARIGAAAAAFGDGKRQQQDRFGVFFIGNLAVVPRIRSSTRFPAPLARSGQRIGLA
jgi:hypothetical protein